MSGTISLLWQQILAARELKHDIAHILGDSSQAHNITERFLLGMVNVDAGQSLYEGCIFKNIGDYHPVAKKMASEIIEYLRKHKRYNIDSISLPWRETLSRRDYPGKFILCQHIPTGGRAERMFEKFGIDATIEAYMRYEAILAGSQHWGMPQSKYDSLHALGFTREGFASPFNTRLGKYEDSRYCSLFKEDEKFGGIGDFFLQTDNTKLWVINPPYIEEIMNRVYEYVTRCGMIGIVMFPTWNDNKGYQSFVEDEEWKDVVLHKRRHILEKPDGSTFIANHADTIFIHSQAPEGVMPIIEDWMNLK